MPRHEHFEELCSLAVLGEVSPAELAELTEHLHECDGCQAAYADFIALANDHLSIAGRGLGRSGDGGAAPATPNLRQSTLKRVVAEGLRVSPEAMQGPVDHKSRAAQWLRDLGWTLPAAKTTTSTAAIPSCGKRSRIDQPRSRNH